MRACIEVWSYSGAVSAEVATLPVTVVDAETKKPTAGPIAFGFNIIIPRSGYTSPYPGPFTPHVSEFDDAVTTPPVFETDPDITLNTRPALLFAVSAPNV